MSVFTTKFDVTSGKMEWILMNDAFDYSQQIARSAYADMLHDNDRNEKYYEALKIAIEKVHESGRKALVLDIGTGTGILSMMAAQCGADSVFACEFFNPMSKCAEKIIHLNGFENKIKVIHKGSCQLTVGEKGDIPHRVNILVTEIFDTELIGEGAIKTFIHAQEELLENDAIVIPSSARIYASVFESNLVNAFNKVQDAFSSNENTKLLKVPESVKNCAGSASVHDVQLSQLPNSSFKLVSNSEIVLKFDWSGKQAIQKRETKFLKMKANYSCSAHGVFMWWDLLMDPEGKIVLSCAPKWSQIGNESYAWRDHWMQAIYYFPKNIKLKPDQEFVLVTNHDEYSLWFDVNTDSNVKSNYDAPVCNCGLHLTSRMRIGMINDKSRQSKFSEVLTQFVTKDTVCVNFSECSTLSHYVALLGAKKVYCFETNRIFQNALENIAEYNNIRGKLQWESTVENIYESIKQNNETISLVLAEPYFSASILPWHNLQFWYFKNKLSSVLSENVRIIPNSVEFYLMPVQFENLWKIRAPIKKIKGFNLKPFDEIIQEAISITDDSIDAQPLWEYPCIALCEPKKFMRLNFIKNSHEDLISENKLQFKTNGICDGIVLWVNWILCEDKNIKISSGPVDTVIVGKNVHWDMYSKQGVHFIKSRDKISSLNYLSYSIKFISETANFSYCFKIL